MNKIEYLAMLADSDFEAACVWAENNIKPLSEFFETWAKNCGAPKSVFIGHTVKMLIESASQDGQ